MIGSTMRSPTKSRVWLLAGVLVLAASVSGRVLQEARIGAILSRRLMSTDAGALVARELDAAQGPGAVEAAGKRTDRKWVFLAGFGSAFVVLVVVAAGAIAYFRYKRRSTAVIPWKQGMSGQLQRALEAAAPLLRREDVEVACEDFSNIIGQAADNVMYKGTLPDGTEIAATSMRVSAESWSTAKELSFRRKVEALARMKHRHLVNLVGYCSEEEPFTRILVFEYACNGALHDHLRNKESEPLDWPARMRVVMGVAHGLAYMHHELAPPASHLNLDASAVFLTDDYAAKVANFGVSTKGGAEGLPGPDFESNVYSFGVLLLEVISGRAPHCERAGELVHWAAEYLRDHKMVWYMVDPALKTYNHDELDALCRIVTLCLAPRNRRPPMRKVAAMLADALKLSPDAVAPKSTALLWAQLELNDDTPADQQS